MLFNPFKWGHVEIEFGRIQTGILFRQINGNPEFRLRPEAEVCPLRFPSRGRFVLTQISNNFKRWVLWASIAHSIQRLATGWTVRGSNPGGGEIFRTCPDLLWGPPNLLHNEYQVLPGGKAARAWHWPPTPSSAEVKERVELYFYSTSGPSWPVLGWPLPLLLLLLNEGYCFTFLLPCIVIDLFLNNQPDALIIQIYSVIKLYIFRAPSLPIIRSSLLYNRHW